MVKSNNEDEVDIKMKTSRLKIKQTRDEEQVKIDKVMKRTLKIGRSLQLTEEDDKWDITMDSMRFKSIYEPTAVSFV